MRYCNVTVLYNKDGVEEPDKDTEISAVEICNVLENNGFKTELFPVTKKSLREDWRFGKNIIFNLVEWTGVDAIYAEQVFKKLEKCKTIFTGCGSKAHMVNCNKILIKEFLDECGVRTPNWQVVNGDTIKIKDFRYPVIVKPIESHCSEGIDENSIKYGPEELCNIDKEVLVEEFIQGREIQVTVLEKKGKLFVLPPAEIEFGAGNKLKILTYKSKWDDSSDEFKELKIKEAKMSDELGKVIKDAAIKCFKMSGARDYARVDFRVRGDDYFVLEINTNPSIDFTPQGCVGWSAKSAGLTYGDFLRCIIENSLYRFGVGGRTLGSYAI